MDVQKQCAKSPLISSRGQFDVFRRTFVDSRFAFVVCEESVGLASYNLSRYYRNGLALIAASLNIASSVTIGTIR